MYSANVKEHAEHLEKILHVLRKHRLYAKASKYEIHKHSVEFLGQQICGGGMTLIKAKLKAVHDWSKPHNIIDVQSIMGYANHYRRLPRILKA